MVGVEVRQDTLGVDGRGWGPAGTTGQGPLEDEEEEGGEKGRRRKEKEKEATNIKSNNPHLAGGEKWNGWKFNKDKKWDRDETC